jgi:TetR/AcrR family hemagglutinin/protease transcriptional regulator
MVPDERRGQLLEAGVGIVAGKGIGATRHADLARACRVSVSTVFAYFPNRDALVNAILDEVGREIMRNVIDPALELPDPSLQLAATASLYADFARRRPDYVKAWLIWSMHFAPAVHDHYRRFEKQLIDALARMFKMDAAADPADIRDRCRVIIAASGFLAKMVFEGVGEARREQFVFHVLQSVGADSDALVTLRSAERLVV